MISGTAELGKSEYNKSNTELESQDVRNIDTCKNMWENVGNININLSEIFKIIAWEILKKYSRPTKYKLLEE